MMKKTGIGVVGCGGFCRGNHIPNLLGNPAVHLKTLCDLKTDGLVKFGVADITTDMEKVFADPENFPPFTEILLSYALTVEKPDGTLENHSPEMLEAHFKQFDAGFNRLFGTEEEARAAKMIERTRRRFRRVVFSSPIAVASVADCLEKFINKETSYDRNFNTSSLYVRFSKENILSRIPEHLKTFDSAVRFLHDLDRRAQKIRRELKARGGEDDALRATDRGTEFPHTTRPFRR